MRNKRRPGRVAFAVSLVLTAIVTVLPAAATEQSATERASFIIQAGTAAAAAQFVRDVGGEVTQEFHMTWSVGATLTPEQLLALQQRHPEASVHSDKTTETPRVSAPH